MDATNDSDAEAGPLLLLQCDLPSCCLPVQRRNEHDNEDKDDDEDKDEDKDKDEDRDRDEEKGNDMDSLCCRGSEK